MNLDKCGQLQLIEYVYNKKMWARTFSDLQIKIDYILIPMEGAKKCIKLQASNCDQVIV